ncbi:MAG: polyhydroxyalkanoate depolymerase [Deltaproteobacteria bacterium]
MRQMAQYEMMESLRAATAWMGSTTKVMAETPMMKLFGGPMSGLMQAWGEVTERSFERMAVKPEWNLTAAPDGDGKTYEFVESVEVAKPFGNLIRFKAVGRQELPRRVLLVAPMSGHHATLLRPTVESFLPDSEVWVTDWVNARDVAPSDGRFDIADYTRYLIGFMTHLGPDTHVVAVCQPVPLALVATAWMAEHAPESAPLSLTLIGGPVDPDAAPTAVTDFGSRLTMGQLESSVIQRVSPKFKGSGRLVYPGLMQLMSFISMNSERHAKSFSDEIMRRARGEEDETGRFFHFYDEYLSVMDMPAEFFLSTVERIFQDREIARNMFTLGGQRVDIGKITKTGVFVVEGENDDISAPGQCLAALDLLTGLPDAKKRAHLEPGAGHYGIFGGHRWGQSIRPQVLDFMDAQHAPAKAPAKAKLKAV